MKPSGLLHSKHTHLSADGRGRHAAFFASVESRICVDIPVDLCFFILLGAVPTFLLGTAGVPAECPRHAVEPLRTRGYNCWEGILRSRNRYMVALLQLYSTFAIKRAVSRSSGVAWNRDSEMKSIGKNHRPEGKSVWANGREKNGWDVRVN